MQLNKNSRRLKKSRKIKALIRESLSAHRLTVNKSNQHIYAQIFENNGARVVVSASTLEKDFQKGNNIDNSKKIGQVIAQRAIEKGISECSFDRSGYPYHGRVKALAEAARKGGLKF